MIDARYTLDKYRQHDKELNSTYFDHFKALVESFEHYGGSIGTDIGLLRELEDDTDPDHPVRYQRKVIQTKSENG